MSTLRTLCVTLICFGATRAAAQREADEPVLGAKAVSPTVSLRIYNPVGKVRVVAWNRDSVVVRGRVANRDKFFFSGSGAGVKLGVEGHENAVKLGVDPASPNGLARASDFVVYVPTASKVWVRTVSASIDARWGLRLVLHCLRTNPLERHRLVDRSGIDERKSRPRRDDAVAARANRRRASAAARRAAGRGRLDDQRHAGHRDDDSVARLNSARCRATSTTWHRRRVARYSSSRITAATSTWCCPRACPGAFIAVEHHGAIQNGFTRVRPAASAPNSLRLTLGDGGSSVTVRTYQGSDSTATGVAPCSNRFLRDIRFAWRNLRRTPVVTAVAVLSIALGIAATTSMFSVVDAALFRPPPLSEPDRLAILLITRQEPGAPLAMQRWSWPRSRLAPTSAIDRSSASHRSARRCWRSPTTFRSR